MTTSTVPSRPAGPPVARMLALLAGGAAVSVAIGVYAKVHDPTGEQPYTLFFTRTIDLKVWFATAAVVLALVQLLLALRLYGRLGRGRPVASWLGDLHRLTGTLAFAVSLPVAYHCLWSLGFRSTTTRVLLHSLLGCFFYGIFTVKVLAVRVRALPGWVLPVVGGTVFAALVLIWATSSLWFFQHVGIEV